MTPRSSTWTRTATSRSSSYRSIAKDSNDKVYAVVDEYLVEFLVIEEVDDKKPSELLL